ncbi:hypothetical protein Tco_0643361 [Tanacetum coccineum]
MKAVRSSSHVSIVPSLSSPNHVFPSPVSEKGNIIRRTASFTVSLYADSEEFMNVFMRIDFGSTIKLVSFCVYVCVYVDYVGVGTQSIERDHLIGIGVVLNNSFRSLLSDGEMIIEI